MPVLCGFGNRSHACVVCYMCGSRSFSDRETWYDNGGLHESCSHEACRLKARPGHTPYLGNGLIFSGNHAVAKAEEKA